MNQCLLQREILKARSAAQRNGILGGKLRPIGTPQPDVATKHNLDGSSKLQETRQQARYAVRICTKRLAKIDLVLR